MAAPKRPVVIELFLPCPTPTHQRDGVPTIPYTKCTFTNVRSHNVDDVTRELSFVDVKNDLLVRTTLPYIIREPFS